MSARPGSSLWLLKHEVRMFFYNLNDKVSTGPARRGMGKSTIAILVLASLAIHTLAYKLLADASDADAQVLAMLPVVATAILIVLFSMMISGALAASVKALFERGDLDLLLSSPLPTRSIFVVRLAGITIGVAALYLFLLAPFANAGLVLGQFRWLAIYPVVLGVAAVAASASMLLTLGLVRLIGVRRTRTVAQVLGAISGAFIFLASQAQSLLGVGGRGKLASWIGPMFAPGAALGPDSIAWLPGRAILGAPLSLVALALAAIAAFGFTAAFTHRFFVHGVQQAVSVVRAATAPAGGPRFRFDRSLAHAVVAKEWRLIARDPQLISQVLLQLLYMVPLGFMLLLRSNQPLAGVGGALTFLCASLTASLTWIIVSAEEAPDLLDAAPCNSATIRRAKLAAVALPAPLLVALPLLWMATRAPGAAMLMAAAVLIAVASSAQIALWCGRPASRGDFKRRGQTNAVGNIIELMSAASWAGIAYFMLALVTGQEIPSSFGIIVSCLFGTALLALLSGWMRRRRVR
ncbi:hypothetical protein Q4S45_00640 [Massilia sp. R2A-15]|uniref:hypothetical protein n=1 Tax=Massilia sp. R2A-15 TaxID=3064278 RepID=UPI002736219D|nr:hypothetical protein [Massilia sp. R2A-15]WLI89659.1 hypothetical protein Q4S45_00640 [Massilia sp. R2A-15]